MIFRNSLNAFFRFIVGGSPEWRPLDCKACQFRIRDNFPFAGQTFNCPNCGVRITVENTRNRYPLPAKRNDIV